MTDYIEVKTSDTDIWIVEFKDGVPTQASIISKRWVRSTAMGIPADVAGVIAQAEAKLPAHRAELNNG